MTAPVERTESFSFHILTTRVFYSAHLLRARRVIFTIAVSIMHLVGVQNLPRILGRVLEISGVEMQRRKFLIFVSYLFTVGTVQHSVDGDALSQVRNCRGVFVENAVKRSNAYIYRYANYINK